jgi:short-subunit dehydrogenase
MCERINNDRVSLVECKDHDFNHALKSIGFHDQLKQTLLSIQILVENNGTNHWGRFPLFHFTNKNSSRFPNVKEMLPHCLLVANIGDKQSL